MTLYLFRRLFTAWLGIVPFVALAPLYFGASVIDVLPPAMFWSGIFASGYIHFRFKANAIWPLFDNLRLRKYRLILVFICTVAIASALVAGFK